MGPEGALATVELLDPTGVAQAAPMLERRADPACTLLQDGRVLVTGGTDGVQSLRSAEVYDPTAGQWSPIAAMSLARSGHSASLTPWGMVLIAGGEPTGTLELLDTAGAFRVVGTLSLPRDNYAVVVLPQRKILLAGGSSNSTSVGSMDLYDVDSGTIARLPDMLTARRGFTASALLDGTVLLAGGYDQSGRILTTTEIYDPATGTSVAGPALRGPRARHQAYTLPNNGQVLIVGGTDGDSILDSTELFVPWNGRVQSGASLPGARLSAAGGPVRRGQVLVAGGRNANGFLPDAATYRFATVEAAHLDYAPGETAMLTGDGWKPGETVLLQVVSLPRDRHRTEFTASSQADGNGHIQFAGFSIDQATWEPGSWPP
jgi:hypothetical protein